MNNFDYRKFYNSNDSARLFLYVLLIPYLAMFLLYGIYMIIGSSIDVKPADFMELLPVAMINAVFMQLCFVAIYFVFNYRRRINFVTATKLNKKPNAWILAISICMGFAFMWFTSPLMSLFELGLTELGFDIRSGLGFQLDNAGTIIFALIGLAIIPAIIEELIFRGAILQGLRKYGDWFAIIISALLFMLMHANVQQTIYQFVFGILAGWLVVKSGSIWVTIAIHAINNIVIITLQSVNEIQGNVSALVVDTPFIIKTVIYLVILGLLMWLGIYLIKRINAKKDSSSDNTALEQTSSKKIKKDKKAKFIENEDGSISMPFKEGYKSYMADQSLRREGLIAIFVSLVFLIVNSVAML